MKRLTPDSPELKSADLVAENIERLRELFPEAFANEGRIDFDVLRQQLGDRVDDGEERYGLNWHGKRAARQLALTPSTGTLRPCPEESVDWDTTQNIFIEGDNLEVLKLLQKSYAGKVKLIYIDPPYNTGNDFVYHDVYRDGIKTYLANTQQLEDGNVVSSASEFGGRFHTSWLNMLYPRLKVAHGLLRQDGVAFISIDDREVAHLRLMCDALFGEENFLANIVWRSRTSISDDHAVSMNHNHTIVYAKHAESVEFHGDPLDPGDYANPDGDPRGPWKLVPLDANKPGGDTLYPIINPLTKQEYLPPKGRSWAINRNEFAKLQADGRIKFGLKDDSAPKKKLFLLERQKRGDTKTPSSVLLDAGTTKDGTEELSELLGEKGVFDYPKPVALLRRLIRFGSSTQLPTIVLDFFAGSATTGHAVYVENVNSDCDRRFICVQLPEPLSVEEKSQKTAADWCRRRKLPENIAEIAKERLRLAAKATAKCDGGSGMDLGFRVFKLDAGNVRPWEASRDTLTESLTAAVDHVKSDRTEDDLLYDMILKHGLDLCAAIDEKQIGSHKVRSVGGGAVFACFGSRITASDVEQLADGIAKWRDELAPANPELSRVVFRDSAFESDVAKTNLALILKERGFDEKLVVSL